MDGMDLSGLATGGNDVSADSGLGGGSPTIAPDISGSPAAGAPASATILGQKPSIATPPDVPGNHAKILGMLQGLAVATSAFGKALGTHGREGGAQDVVAYQEQQRQEARAQQDQQMKMKEFDLRSKALTTQQNLAQFQLESAKQLFPVELQEKFNELNKSTIENLEKLHITPINAVAMVPGQNTATHANSVVQAMPGGTSGAIAIPVQDGAHGEGKGNTNVYSIPQLNDLTTPDFVSSQIASLKGTIDLAEAGKADPKAIATANAQLDILSKANAMPVGDFLKVQQQIATLVGNAAAVTSQRNKTNEETAKTQSAQNEATISGVKATNAATDETLAQKKTKGEIAGQSLTNQKTQQEITLNNQLMGASDPFGNKVGLPGDTPKDIKQKEGKFTKEFIEPMGSLVKSNEEFNRIIDPNNTMTPAEKVTGLLNAVGISFDPLKGKGARLSNDVIQEHAGARDIYQSALQKIDALRPGGGGPITKQQVLDYAKIAQGVVHDSYVYNAREAQRQGLPVDFLPRPSKVGTIIDPATAKIYLDVAGGDKDKAHAAAVKAGYGN